jgi:hypothetical protein
MSKDMSMIAYCGLNCEECLTYLATQKDDDAEREKVAKQWSEEYKVPLKASHINCDGCKTQDGRLFMYCQMCEVKPCGEGKKVETCAHCDDYECDKIQGLFKMAPTIIEGLEKIRAGLAE